MSYQPESTFALLLPDGLFARVYIRQTHGGDRQEIEHVGINYASVMPRYRWRKFEERGVLVEVKETRTVTIVSPEKQS